MKRQEIFSLISDLDLIALQEGGGSSHSFRPFVCKILEGASLSGASCGAREWASSSGVALQGCLVKTAQLDIGDKHRCIATTTATDQPILLASCYGLSDDPPRARAFAREITEALHAFHRPWIALGGWRFEEDEHSRLFAEGLATLLDGPFQVGTPLRTASTPQKCLIEKGSRTISYGYSVEVGLELQGHYAPKRLVLNRQGEAPETEVKASWDRLWQAPSFAEALDAGDVDLAWSLLSDIGGVLTGADGSDAAGGTLRSQKWEPRRAHGARWASRYGLA